MYVHVVAVHVCLVLMCMCIVSVWRVKNVVSGFVSITTVTSTWQLSQFVIILLVDRTQSSPLPSVWACP